LRRSIFLFIAFFGLTVSFAQRIPVASETLSSGEATNLLTDTVRASLGLHFSVSKVYKYSDKSGQYYVVLTENRDSMPIGEDTISDRIKAVEFKIDKAGPDKIWELTDHIIENEHEESSIWFWSKYIDFNDDDNDSLIEPIIVYGTKGLNDFDDGRIGIVIYYKGRKIAIHHQNGVADQERETRVDKAFYSLPQKLQTAVKEKMEAMEENRHAIFPSDWRVSTNNKKIFFSERKQ
jgi:hypothetical protein